MKHLTFYMLTIMLATSLSGLGQTLKVEKLSQGPEEIIRSYFDGWIKKDWNAAAAHLADGFTFTSPAPDDHINIAEFKAKCWLQAEYIKRFDFIKITGNDYGNIMLH